MPATSIDGCSIYYEILGDNGPPVVITPGDRNPLDNARTLAQELSLGFRVLNLWCDQLAMLLRRLEFGPAYLRAQSAGSRVSYVTASRYPEVVRGMYLWLVSGGPVAERLGGGLLRSAREGRTVRRVWWRLTPSGRSASQLIPRIVAGCWPRIPRSSRRS